MAGENCICSAPWLGRDCSGTGGAPPTTTASASPRCSVSREPSAVKVVAVVVCAMARAGRRPENLTLDPIQPLALVFL
jgi:hypothetical protein